MAGDADYQSVALRLHFDGSNGSTTITDTGPRPKTLVARGDAKLSTTQYRFGTASLVLDGAGDSVAATSHSEFDFGTGDFTVCAQARTSKPSATQVIMAQQEAITGVAFQLRTNADKFELVLRSADGTGLKVLSGGTVSANTFQHVEAVRAGANIYLFVDGALVDSGTSSANLTTATPKVFCIGALDDGSGAVMSYWTGYIDEVSVYKGVAKHTSTFTPPTSAFLDYVAEVSGTVEDSTGAAASRTVRAYRRDTGAFLKEGVSTSGSYNLKLTYAGEVNVICLDDVAGTTENDLILRTLPV